MDICNQVFLVLSALLPQPKKCVIAFSGGLDSTVLLHVMSQLRLQDRAMDIRAIHVNHGLNASADEWVQHCRLTCQSLSVDVLSSSSALGVEAAARMQRYRVLKSALATDEVLLCAHHQNDQAETVLLQLMRGTGVSGLAAMRTADEGQGKRIVRPLLHVSRNNLLAYAVHHQLLWIEDSSNQDTTFSRNYVRQHIMPMLTERWPAASELLSRTAQNCQDAELLLQQLAQDDLRALMGSEERESAIPKKEVPYPRLPLAKLKLVSLPRRKNMIRYWLRCLGVKMPSHSVMQQIDQLILSERLDTSGAIEVVNQDCLDVEGAVLPLQIYLRRWRDHLYLVEQQDHSHTGAEVLDWGTKETLYVPSLDLTLHRSMVLPYMPAEVDITECRVRFRQGGERVRLCDEAFHRPLKQCFQQWEVPPWERNRVPLIFHQDQLLLVVGYPFRNLRGKHEQ